MTTQDQRRFILWDPRDGEPRRNEDGTFNTDGVLGRVTVENVYVTVYAAVRDGEKLPRDLDVGAFTVADFNLSGSKGTYRIYRVEDVED